MSQSRPIPRYTIRSGTAEDRPVRLQVSHRAWSAAYAHIYRPDEINGIHRGLLAQHSTWTDRRKERIGVLVAEVDNEIIGFVGMSKWSESVGEIGSLYLDPQYHGLGIGKALWDAGVKVLREQGCDEIWVWVLAKAPAYQFYLRQGCVPEEIGAYTIGTHAEPTLGCVIRYKDPPQPKYPAWLANNLFNPNAKFDWVQALRTTMPRFLDRYTLANAQWLGIWQTIDQDAVVVLEVDPYPMMRKRAGVLTQEQNRMFLVMGFSKIYQTIMNDITSGDVAIDTAESKRVSDIERKVWLQLMRAQTIFNNESAEYILDDQLYQTSIIGLHGDTVHLFHTQIVRFLCLNERGDVIPIPAMKEEDHDG